jgi:hypothetical protein
MHSKEKTERSRSRFGICQFGKHDDADETTNATTITTNDAVFPSFCSCVLVCFDLSTPARLLRFDQVRRQLNGNSGAKNDDDNLAYFDLNSIDGADEQTPTQAFFLSSLKSGDESWQGSVTIAVCCVERRRNS